MKSNSKAHETIKYVLFMKCIVAAIIPILNANKNLKSLGSLTVAAMHRGYLLFSHKFFYIIFEWFRVGWTFRVSEDANWGREL